MCVSTPPPFPLSGFIKLRYLIFIFLEMTPSFDCTRDFEVNSYKNPPNDFRNAICAQAGWLRTWHFDDYCCCCDNRWVARYFCVLKPSFPIFFYHFNLYASLIFFMKVLEKLSLPKCLSRWKLQIQLVHVVLMIIVLSK